MRFQVKTLIAAAGAMMIAAAPAIANAERVYFLVGTRHVYRIGTYQYANVDQRKAIEQDYADQVAQDEEQYNKALADGANPDTESANLNAALEDLAAKRDEQLGSIFERVDYERVRHPELQIDGDGPYQVMGINFHWRGSVEVFDNFVVYAPWPGYIVVGHPYGWAFGVVYNPFAFHHIYLGWHDSYIRLGRPAFVGFYGHHGPVRVGGIMRGPRGGYIHNGGRGSGYIHNGPIRGGGRPTPNRGGFGGGHPTPNRGSFGGGHPTPNRGSFGGGHPTPNRGSFGGGHTTPNRGSFGGGHTTPNRGSFGGGHSAPSHGSFGGGHSAPSHGSFGGGGGRTSTSSHSGGGSRGHGRG